MGNKKANVFDYLEWRGDLSLQQSEFNEVDALILSILSYLDFSSVSCGTISFFRDVVTTINLLPDELKLNGPSLIMNSVIALANDAAKSNRYHDMGVFNYKSITDVEKEIQFAAVTFLLPDNTAFVSFRGTDNTLIGWKEDFNMCFSESIPAQIEAAKYAKMIARQLKMPLRLGGHSKGGNLAIWASTYLPTIYSSELLGIYSNDGPGFSNEFLKKEQYEKIRHKIHSYVPESSIVGVLMEHDEYTTILSSNPSILQHDPFSWTVLGNHFVYDDSRTLSAKQFERVINSWLRSMSVKEREELVENIFEIISSSEARTLDDLDKSKLKSLLSMQKTFREMGLKKQAQLVLSLSKVIFNRDTLVNSNMLSLLSG